VNDIESQLSSLKVLIRENLNIKNSLSVDGSDLKLKRTLQHFSSLKFKEKSIQSLYEILMSYALQAEVSCPSAGTNFLKIISGSSTKEVSFVKNKEDVLKEIQTSGYSKRVEQILQYVLSISDENTKVTIKKSSNSNTYVEQTDGYSFLLKKLINTPYEMMNEVRVACIDGYVENVSELHHLLSDLSDKKASCILICRGMSEDVLHTIKVNNDRKTLFLVPLVCPFDVDNVNTIVDVATVSGTDVISTNKGELISSISFESLGRVETAQLSGGKLVLKNTRTKERVKDHVRHLKMMIEERKDIEIILSKRLRNLSSSCVEISLPDDLKYYSDSQQLDEGIRTIMSCIKNSYDPWKTAEFFIDKFYAFVKDSHVTCLL